MGGAAGAGQRGRRDEGLHLRDERPPPLQGHRHRGARHGGVTAGQEQPARVGQPDDADIGQVEAADLVGRAVAVLHRAHQAQPGVPLALEGDDDVDEVLQQPRPGDRAVLGDMPDEQHGDPPRLGHLDEARGDLTDLPDIAGGALDLRAGEGLHRVDDDEIGPARLDLAEHDGQVGLGGQMQRRGHRLDPLGPQPHLRRRLLAADVQHGAPLAGRPRGDVEQQRGLADPRLTGHEHDRPGHQPAAEHPVELADPGGPGHRPGHVDLADPRWRPDRRRGGAGSGSAGAQLADRAPRLALPAPTHPLDRAPPAFGAPVCRPGPPRPLSRLRRHALDGRRGV